MEDGSPSRRWADVAEDELPPQRDFFAGSPGLLRECFLARGPAERVALSDSEDYSDAEAGRSP